MSTESNRRRSRRIWLIALCGFIFCLVFANSTAFAEIPSDAPVLISHPNSTKVFAGVETRRGLDHSDRVFAPGEDARIVLYVTNLIDLLEGEGATAFRADAQDASGRRYPLAIESFEPTAERAWVYALTVRLNPEIGDVGDVLVRVTWRGMSSNRVRLSVGREGSKLPDDEGAIPTPMPDKEIKGGDREANAVGLQFSGDRIRFMNQTTFGGTPQLDQRLRRISLATWIAEQTEQKFDGSGNPRYSSIPYPTQTGTNPDLPLMPQMPAANCLVACQRDNYSMFKLQNWFVRETLYGEDQQLRRRVSWALHQIFVVSGRETQQASRMLPYVKLLDRHAFGNYKDLLRDITLNPGMGNYLDMARSTAQNPNENYAREILQLFSIGLDMLNQDGTPILDGQGNRIPSYTQDHVNNFTKVYTGWTFCNNGADTRCANFNGNPNYIDPMIQFGNNHDTTQKVLLNYPNARFPVLPAGQTPDQDLEQSIENIFHHPNVAPFIGKILIQQLVTSNPTPAYVGRVSAVFNNNGRGERGDMRAVIRAILLDPEARGNMKTDPDYGHLREPLLYATNILRPYNPVSANSGVGTQATNCGGQSDGVINGVLTTLDQDIFNPPTVFNYYPFDYTLPNTNLSAPEFAIFSTGTALKRANFINQMTPPAGGDTANGIQWANGNNVNAAIYIPCGTRITLPELQTLVQSDPSGASLVETLNKRMLNGSMSAQMRNEILQAVQAVASSDSLKRARTAFYLVATSSQFQVQR